MAEQSVIKTAGRIFEVFEYFDVVQRPSSLKEIAEQFGYPVSSASVLLKSLVMLGYLDYDRASRTYMPTMRCHALGHWVPGALFDDNQVLGIMERLSAITEQPVSIATQSDVFAQYVHVFIPASCANVAIRAGTVRSIARSGLGWLLLSSKSDAAIDKLVRRINYGKSDTERVGLSEVLGQVHTIQKQGYVFSKHTVQRGKGVIGMMTPIQRYGRTFALGVGGTVRELEQKEMLILEEMKRSVHMLSSPGAHVTCFSPRHAEAELKSYSLAS
ncbi:IclR family transcriptional regulator [Rhodopseudomonas palustris]|nr:helix-turn-helix domain-containing protein [Rhodopseudomonas palustris]